MHKLNKVSLIIFLTLISTLVTAQSSPFKNFDALCELFKNNYATFEHKGIEWEEDCFDVRSTISEDMTDAELFTAMTSYLLSQLNDAHTNLIASNIDSSFSASRESRIMNELASLPGTERRPKFRAMTEATLTANNFKPVKEIGPEVKDEKLFSYTKNGNTGYLRYMRSFSTTKRMVGPDLKEQLDQIFSYFEGLESIIIDIRFNIGGDDAFSKLIAGYLIDSPRIGFHKQTRKKGKFQGVKTKMLKPSKRHLFKGNVVLLTNDRTVSAADVMALMLYDMPQATIIGENSNGSFSDLMDAKLPNGWIVTLSNQRYFSGIERAQFEGEGVPVDKEVKNTLKDLEKQSDSVLLAALEHLKK
jgi:C-terminal processing protease CtpA/Prc